KENPITSKEIHSFLIEKMKVIQERKTSEYRSALASISQGHRKLQEKITNAKEVILTETDSSVRASYPEDLRLLLQDIKAKEKDMEAIKEALGKNKVATLKYEKFLELFKNLALRTEKSRKMDELDFIVRFMFLNFTIKDQKVANYKLKPPF